MSLRTPTEHFENTDVGQAYVCRHPHSTQTAEVKIETKADMPKEKETGQSVDYPNLP